MDILLNPGPVNLSERVRAALLRPDICHREPEFTRLQESLREQLLAVYGLPAADWAAVLLTGSGTAAMEAMMVSLIPAAGRVLIIENGVYGERLASIARIHGIDHDTLHYAWGEAIRSADVAAALGGGFSHLAVIHHETTSGRLNDLNTLGALCAEHGTTLLVDGVSSFGAEELRFTEWHIDACAATANKCLHAIPGAAFVILRRAALDRAAAVRRTLYLDLQAYLQQQDAGGTPFTQSVPSFYALEEALQEHREQGGWSARRSAYRRKLELVRNGLCDLGIEPLLPGPECSCVLHAFHLPAGLDYRTLHDGLKQRGFVIYAGQGKFASTLFRISVMGTCSEADLNRFLDAVRAILASR